MKRNIRLITFAILFSLPTMAFAGNGDGNGDNNGNGDGLDENINGNSSNGNGNPNGNGNGGNGNHYGWDPSGNGGSGNNVPLDGGLSFLAAAGIGYAAKKYTARKKESGK